MLVHSASHGGIALRIEIDQEHAPFGGRQRGGEIDGGGGLSNPAFLICNCDDPLHGLLDLGRTGESSTRCRSSSSPGTLRRCTARTRNDLGRAEISSSGRFPFIASKRPSGAHKCPAYAAKSASDDRARAITVSKSSKGL